MLRKQAENDGDLNGLAKQTNGMRDDITSETLVQLVSDVLKRDLCAEAVVNAAIKTDGK